MDDNDGDNVSDDDVDNGHADDDVSGNDVDMVTMMVTMSIMLMVKSKDRPYQSLVPLKYICQGLTLSNYVVHALGQD